MRLLRLLSTFDRRRRLAGPRHTASEPGAHRNGRERCQSTGAAPDPPTPHTEQYPQWRASPLGQVTERIEQELIFDLAGPLADLRVLDAGCGDGRYAVVAAGAGAQVIAVDTDPEVLELARRRATASGADLHCELADLRALPFADASFDLVLAVAVLCFVDDAGAAMKELARVLRPGGRLVVGELHRWSSWAALRRVRGCLGSATWRHAQFRSARELTRSLRAAGLRVERVEGAVYYPPLDCAATAFERLDRRARRLTTLGAAFIAASASKPRCVGERAPAKSRRVSRNADSTPATRMADSPRPVSGTAVSNKGRIKGVPIQHFLSWWEEAVDPSQLPVLADHLERRGHAAWMRPGRPTLGLLPSVWYPAEFVHDLLDHLLEGESQPDLQTLAVMASDHAMSRILSGVYRAVFSMLATPERYPRYAQRIWDMHYDSGTLEFSRVGAHEHHSSFDGWRAHHPFICMLNVQSARAIYSSMGCAAVEVDHSACVSRGDRQCRSTVRWQRSG